MAVANNWEVLIARGIISAPKTEIIVPPIDPPISNKRFVWGTTAKWRRGIVVDTGDGNVAKTDKFMWKKTAKWNK